MGEETHFGVGAMLLLELFSFGQRTCLLRGQPISYMCTALWLITRACGQLGALCEVETWGARFLRAILSLSFFFPPKADLSGSTFGLNTLARTKANLSLTPLCSLQQSVQAPNRASATNEPLCISVKYQVNQAQLWARRCGRPRRLNAEVTRLNKRWLASGAAY